MVNPSTQQARLSELIQLSQLNPNILNRFLTIANISLSNDNNIFIFISNYLDYLESIENIVSILDKIKEIHYILYGVIKFLNRFCAINTINAIRINIFYQLSNRAYYLYARAIIISIHNRNANAQQNNNNTNNNVPETEEVLESDEVPETDDDMFIDD
jgi:hypothetical protein